MEDGKEKGVYALDRAEDDPSDVEYADNLGPSDHANDDDESSGEWSDSDDPLMTTTKMPPTPGKSAPAPQLEGVRLTPPLSSFSPNGLTMMMMMTESHTPMILLQLRMLCLPERRSSAPRLPAPPPAQGPARWQRPRLPPKAHALRSHPLGCRVAELLPARPKSARP
jgi:hypothetical protein